MHALSIALVYFSPLIEDNECAARQIFISSNSTRVNVFFCGIKNDVASHKTSDNEKQPITKSPRRNSNTAIPFSRHINSESQSARIILFAPNPINILFPFFLDIRFFFSISHPGDRAAPVEYPRLYKLFLSISGYPRSARRSAFAFTIREKPR